MATPEQAMRWPVVEVRGPSQRLAWALWITAAVGAALPAAMITWQIRRPFDLSQSSETQRRLTFVATVVGTLIVSTGQWLELRHYRIDAYWWIPATMTAGVAARLSSLTGPSEH